MMPGHRLREWARRVCSEETMIRLIDPLIADLQYEATETSRDPRRRRRLWILAAGYFAFWKVVALHLPWAALRRFWNSATAGEGVARALTYAALAFTVLTLLLTAPPLPHLHGRNNAEQAWLFVLLLPQAVALSMPVALFVGVVCALRRRAVTTLARRTISVLAVAASLAMFFIINGLVPASGEAFRETLAARAALEGRQYVLERGPMELSLLEVRRQALALKRESRPRQAGWLLLTFHQRVSLAAAPLALTLLAFGLSRARVRMAATIAGTACTVFVAWMFAASNMDRAMLSHEWVAIALAWFPPVLLIATGMALLTVRLKPRATGSG